MSTHTSYENNGIVFDFISYNAKENEIILIGPYFQSITLPANPSPGSYIILKRVLISFSQHFPSIGIFRNGNKINGLENDYLLYTLNDIYLFYVNSTIGWITDYISNAVKIENNKLTKFDGIVPVAGLASDGSAWTCGNNTYGQLGNNTRTDSSKPVSVVGGFSFSNIFCGGTYFIGINGANGSAWAWGSNTNGSLGTYNTTSYSSPASVVGGFSFTKIANFNNCSVGINGANGSAWAWGENTYGQLGDNSRTNRSSPVSVVGGFSFKDIACGDYFSVGINGADGSAWAWGYGYYGRIGNNTVNSYSSPVSVVGGFSFSKIYCSFENTIGIRGSDGSAWAWGAGSSGRNGDSSITNRSSPISVMGGFSFSQLSGGSNHWLGINGANGSAWAWGENTYGQLGINSNNNKRSPNSVKIGYSFSEIAATNGASFFVRGSDNFNFCCGANLYGELGLNTLTSYNYVVMRIS
jgi:alpha-tubulin suppressor-like RCC1 family protein